MKAIWKSIGIAACLAGLSAGASAQPHSGFMDKLESEDRPLEDRMRDDVRRPAQVMDLLEAEEGMTVVDVAAGGGWYTRVLSAAVGPEGQVIAQFGPRALQRENGRAQRDLAQSLGNVEPFFGELGEIEAGSADRAITALSLHHRDESFLQDIYNLLKPGGIAVVIDHEGSRGGNNGEMHRMVAADARQWLENVGFEVEESDVLHTNADDHSLNIRDPRLGRNTDRFLFVARKPE